MNEEHASALALVRALREMGAAHVRVGEVEARFDLTLMPLPAVGMDGDAVEAEVKRRMAKLERELGIGG